MELTHHGDLYPSVTQLERLLSGEVDSSLLEWRGFQLIQGTRWIESFRESQSLSNGGAHRGGLTYEIVEHKPLEAERLAIEVRMRQQNTRLQASQQELSRRIEELMSELSNRNQLLMAEIEVRKQLEAHVQQAKKFAETIIHAFSDMLFEVSRTGHCLNVWAHPLELLVAQKQMLLGKTVHEIYPVQDAETVMSAIREAEISGNSSTKIVALSHFSGTRWFDISITKNRGSDSADGSFIVLSRDVTSRKRTEEALAIREREFRSLAESIPDNIARYDRNGVLVFFNAILRKKLTGSAAVMIGRRVRERYPDGRFELYAQALDSVLATGNDCEFEISIPDSRVYSDEVYQIRLIAERDENDQVIGVLAIGRDVSALRCSDHKLEASRSQLRSLISRRETDLETERKRIAREVHDELGQLLTGLQMKIYRLVQKCSQDCSNANERLQDILLLSEKALGVARNVASALRPTVLDMGISTALEWLADRFHASTGIHCQLHLVDGNISLTEDQAVPLFRIAQESLTNISRHARADQVSICLEKEGTSYVLRIRDNGVGFDGAIGKSGSFGLVGMQERVMMLGGALDINTRLGGGTEIVVRIPIQ